MTTFGTMKDRIADEVRAISTAAASDIETQIGRAIRSAVLHYERERFYFNEATGTFSLSDSQEYYTSTDNADIPNLVSLDSVRLTVTGTRYTLLPRPFAYIDSISTAATSYGGPTDYAYYKQQIRVYPIPNAGRLVTFAGIKKFATLSATDDTNAWVTDAEELIRARAKWDLYLNVVKDPDQATAAKTVEMDALVQLRGESAQKAMTGRITPTSF